ncbi:MAG TPA: MFS transporter [Candidatus Dormibacteraeota bacterium]|nr:MFS transporter [Candidatus Dormibacteraeota bacterium]
MTLHPMSSYPSATHQSSRQLIIYGPLFAGFIVTGVVTTILGPILPVFIARWQLDDAHAGLFFTTQFMGSLSGVGLSSVLLHARGYKSALVPGFLLMAIGIGGLNAGSLSLALLATAAFGCGYGLATPGTNLYVAETAGPKRAPALTLLNLAWGVGAVMCPVLMLAALRYNHFSRILFLIAANALLLALILLFVPFVSRAHYESTVPSGATHATTIQVPIALGLLFFLYVGTENGVSGWAAEQAKRVGFGARWTLAPMFFWAGLLTGRALATLLLLRIKEIRLVIGGLLIAAAGTLVLLLATTGIGVIFGVTFAGLGLASLYPIFIAWLSKWYGARARRMGGIMFSLAALGGATLPWTVGFLSKHANSLRIGLLVPLAACFAMIFLVALLRRRIAA